MGVLMGQGLGCTDLDHCVDPSTGKIAPWAREIIINLDSYSEFSPSGTGVHILGDDISLPGKGRKRPYETGAVEVYDTARFLTFTGRLVAKDTGRHLAPAFTIQRAISAYRRQQRTTEGEEGLCPAHGRRVGKVWIPLDVGGRLCPVPVAQREVQQ